MSIEISYGYTNVLNTGQMREKCIKCSCVAQRLPPFTQEMRVSFRFFNGFPVVKLGCEPLESCFVSLHYYENGSSRKITELLQLNVTHISL